MKLHRFIGEFELRPGNLKLRNEDLYNQLKNVLRIEIGESIVLSDGKMNEAEATLTALSKNECEFEVHNVRQNDREPERQVTLFAAILKGERFELAIEKAVESGVYRIQPIITERTVKTGLRLDRLQKIAKEAAEQSGRGVVPEISSPMPFSKVLPEADKFDTALFFDASGKTIRNSKFNIRNSVALFVGPEGGWSENEIAAAKKAKIKFASLGSLTLRAETAAIVGSYLVAHDLLD